MHILATAQTSFDDIVAPVDLGQTPGDIAVLSFADSDLAALAAAWAAEQGRAAARAPRASARSAPSDVGRSLGRARRRPCQGDPGAAHRRARLVALRRRAAFRGRARERASRWRCCPARTATIRGLRRPRPCRPDELAALLRYFREGGLENLRALLAPARARHAGGERFEVREPQPLPRCAGYLPGVGAVDLDRLAASLPAGRPVVPVIFYRALLLAADTAAIDALCAALEAHGLAPAPLVITSLKEPAAADFVRGALARLAPGRDRHHDGVRVRRARRADAARRARRAGVPGGDRDHQARGMAGRRARPRRGRSCDACRAPRARRARARRRHRVQGCAARGRRPRLHRLCQSPGAGPHRSRRRARGGAGAPCCNAARRAPRRDADARLSRRARPHRLCGRARRAGERGRAARRSRGRRLRRAWRAGDAESAARCAGRAAMPSLPLEDYARLFAELPHETAGRHHCGMGSSG